jgi:hypothetical protein
MTSGNDLWRPFASDHVDISPRASLDDQRKHATELLEAIELGLPDSQFAADTLPSLHRLADVLDTAQHNQLVGYLRQAKRLTNVDTQEGRNAFRPLSVSAGR